MDTTRFIRRFVQQLLIATKQPANEVAGRYFFGYVCLPVHRGGSHVTITHDAIGHSRVMWDPLWPHSPHRPSLTKWGSLWPSPGPVHPGHVSTCSLERGTVGKREVGIGLKGLLV